MDTENLLQNVRDFFLDQYKDLSKTDSYIAFEPIGCVVNPEEYKDDTSGAINTTKVNEDISEIVDRVPEISDVFMPGLDKISSQYEILVKSAHFNSKAITSNDMSDYIALLGKIKSDAEKLLMDADRLSVVNIGGKFYPATMIPERWYDTQSAIWANKEFHLEDTVILDQPEAAKPIDKKMRFLWKSIAVEKINPTIVNESSPALKASINSEVFAKHIANVRALELNSVKEMPVNRRFIDTDTSIRAVQPIEELAVPVAHRIDVIPDAEVSSKAEVIQSSLIAKELFNFKPELKTSISAKADFGRLLMSSNALVEAKPINSTNLSLSFDYSIVQIHRFWFNTQLFDFSKLWYTLAQQEGFFSSGQRTAENRGNLRAIPKAFILVKNLKIHASWSESDKEMVKNSVGFGCFNLASSSFNQENELTNPALQIIGWLCEVMPKTPATSDPFLA